MGAIVAESLVLPRASRESYVSYLRLQTASAIAIERAVTEFGRQRGSGFAAVFPSQPSHADHAEAMALPASGRGRYVSLCR